MNYTKLVIPLICVFIVLSGCTDTERPVIVSGDTMSVYYVDVGQGDSEIIKTPSGRIILIDAGDTGKDDEISYYLDKLNVTSIHTVIVSHPHADHIGGMSKILDNYEVENFIESGYPTTTLLYENMLDTIEEKNITYKIVSEGDILPIDPEVQMIVLNPRENHKNLNDNSIVVRMKYNNVSFLFTGDIEKEEESKLRNVGRIDILKVAHHGSDSSTSSFFSLSILPSVSIISVGEDNKYNHPSSDVIRNLNVLKSVVYRTDRDGTVIVTTDGNVYNIETTKLNVWH